MLKMKRLLIATAVAASTLMASFSADAFFGPFNWMRSGGWGGGPWGWGGGPWGWGGYPYYGWGYPYSGWGYPYGGWGGYPYYGYGWGSPWLGTPWLTAPVVVQPSTTAAEK